MSPQADEDDPRADASQELPTGRGQSRRWRAALIPLALLCVAVLMCHHPMIRSGFSRMQTDTGDTRLNNYFLEHTWRVITCSSGGRGLWNPGFFYPEESVGAFGDMLLSVAPPYWLYRLAGFAPDTAFQLWMITVTVANWAVFFLFLRSGFRLETLPAALGAVLFAAGSSRVAQMSHQQLLAHVYPVLAFLALARLFAPDADPPARTGTRRWKTSAWLALLFASVAAQFWGGIYNAVFLCLLLGSLALAGAFFRPVRARAIALVRGHWPDVVVLACLAAAVVLPLLLRYREAARLCGTRPWATVGNLSPRAQSWLYMGDLNWIYGRVAGLGIFRHLYAQHEHALGLGLLTTLAAAAGLWRRRSSPAVRLLAIFGVLWVLLITRWTGRYSGWYLLYRALPGVSALRAVVRFGMLLTIPAGVGLALFVRERERTALWWVVPLVSLCLLEQGQASPSYDKHLVRDHVAAVGKLINPRRTAFYLAVDSDGVIQDNINLDAMWAGLHAGVPSVNGYAGTWTPALRRVRDPRAGDPQALRQLESRLNAYALEQGVSPDDIQFIVIDACTLSPEASRVVAVSLPQSAPTGSRLRVPVTVENCGRTLWPPTRRSRIKVGVRFFRKGPNGPGRTWVEARADLEAPVGPGEVLETVIAVRLRDVPPGEYEARFDMVNEGRYWFEERGSRSLRQTIRILPRQGL